MRPDQQAQDWNELAQLDPYWVILTAADKRFGGWDSDEFFAIGTVEVAAMMERFERLGHPAQRERALDFGCGLGRITRALAQHFDEAVGVDISEDMVRRAQELNADVPGASFVVNVASDLARFDDAAFDLVFSSIVLQHVPDRSAIEGYVAEFCRVVRPGGLVMFQLPSHIPAIYRTQWRRRLYGGLRRRRSPRPVPVPAAAAVPDRDELHPRARDRAADRVRRRAPARGRQDRPRRRACAAAPTT